MSLDDLEYRAKMATAKSTLGTLRAFEESASPDVVLKLIAVARAAEAIIGDEWFRGRSDLMKALAALEAP